MKPGRLGRGVVAAAATLLVAMGAPAAVQAQSAPVVMGGVTQPVFGYTDAVRERLWVTADFDSDLNGVADEIAMDIIRPAAGATGLKSPVIMDASPYFTTLCRGNEGECIADVDGDGLNDRWPLFYDNYFVPRGYAVMLLHMVGTGFSTGCPVTGGTPDNRSAVLAIDWLNGRRTAHDAAGNTVAASWHNGKSGMIGKSYDGTLANAAAAAGVDGLTTIVPISAISTWYNYTRQAGLGLSGWANNYAVEPLEHGDEPGPPGGLRRRSHDPERHRRRRELRLHAVLARARLLQGHRQRRRERFRRPRHPGRQRQGQPVQRVVVRARRARRPAQALAGPRRPRGAVRLPARRLGEHAPPLVRPLALRRPQRDHERADGDRRARGRRRLRGLRRLADPGRGGRQALLPGDAVRARRAVAEPGRGLADDVVPRSDEPEREHDHLEPRHGHRQQARVPVAAPDRAPQVHRDAGHQPACIRQPRRHLARRRARGLRAGDEGEPHQQRRRRERHREHLLRRVERERRRVLHQHGEGPHERHAVAGHAGHPRRTEPHRPDHPDRPRPGPVLRLQLQADAGGLHLPGRAPDRRRHRRHVRRRRRWRTRTSGRRSRST